MTTTWTTTTIPMASGDVIYSIIHDGKAYSHLVTAKDLVVHSPAEIQKEAYDSLTEIMMESIEKPGERRGGQLRVKRGNKRLWRSANGKTVHIKDLDSNHLINILNLLHRSRRPRAATDIFYDLLQEAKDRGL